MLIHSGTGSGTCQWAAQMAKLRGYKVIGTCSKSKKTSRAPRASMSSSCTTKRRGLREDYTSVDLCRE